MTATTSQFSRSRIEYKFEWKKPVDRALLDGAYFERWDEDLGLCETNFLRVDEYGFYVQWLADGKEASVLDMTQIFEIRPGPLPKDGVLLSKLDARQGEGSLEDRSLVISSGVDLVNVTYHRIVAQTAATAQTWLDCLRPLLLNNRMPHVCPLTCLRKHWKMLCLSVNERRKIPIKSITRTFASGKTEKMVHKCLIDLGLGAKDDEVEPAEFPFEKFYALCNKICPRSDIQDLFNKISKGEDYVSYDRLENFLNDDQRDPRLNEILYPFFDRPLVEALVEKHEVIPEFKQNGRLSWEGFLRYLMSDENAPVFLDRIDLYQDMDNPFCHYLINSSHNTYLVGKQFAGRSSVEMYRQVLLSGCRCIELDIWDGTGDSRGEPIITHGKAMCTDIPFKDVIVAIKETAFVASEYPVILSFENHCSRPLQLQMARICMEVFGDLLLNQPLDSNPLEPGVPLPSPAALKNKILIKNKRLKPDVEKVQLEQFLAEGKLDEDDEADPENPDIVVGEDGPLESSDDDGDEPPTPGFPGLNGKNASESQKALKKQFLKGELPAPVGGPDNEAHPELKHGKAALVFKNKIQAIKDLTKTAKEPQLSKEQEEQLLSSYKYTGATTNIHPLLSNMINYTHPIKFQGFDVAEQNNIHYHMSSFSENTALGVLKQNAIELVNYNKRQVSRIYPKGGRVESSNFLPQIFWNAGIQMVALNFQTPDLGMQLNWGRFEYNGNCGYLLKPEFMRRADRMFDPFSESPVDGVIAAYCSIKVISGQFLSDKKVGTYVEIGRAHV